MPITRKEERAIDAGQKEMLVQIGKLAEEKGELIARVVELRGLLRQWEGTIGSVDAQMSGPRYHVSQAKLREVIPATRAALEKDDD